MPLPIGHAAIGIATHNIFSDGNRQPINWQVGLLIVVLSNLPDIDVIFGLILQNNVSAFHRGPTHSILFSLVGGYAVYKVSLWLKKTQLLSWKTCVAIVFSHNLADYFFTTAPVSFFWPFEVYWSTDSTQWQQVFHTVFFEAAKDGAIVFGCAVIIIANMIVRRIAKRGGLRKTMTRYPFSFGRSLESVLPAKRLSLAAFLSITTTASLTTTTIGCFKQALKIIIPVQQASQRSQD